MQSLSSVIAGLDPAIHLLRKNALAKRMDPRVKPAGDAREWVSVEPIGTGTAFSVLIPKFATFPVMARSGPHAQQFCWRRRPAVIASSLHEPSRARCAAWRFRIGLVSPGACAADDAGDRFPSFGRTRTECQSIDGIPQGLARGRFRRRPKCLDRVPVGRRPERPAAGACCRSGPPWRERHHCAFGNAGRVGREGRHANHSNCFPGWHRSGGHRARRQPEPAGRQRDRHQLAQRRNPPQTDRVVARVGAFDRQHFRLGKSDQPQREDNGG